MGGARIALNGGDAVHEVVGIFGGVSPAAGASGLFVHPGDDTQGARRTQVKALQDFRGLHGDDDAGSIVDGTGAEVPGIEVSGDNHDLLGMLGAFEIGDDVVTGFVGKFLRRECEVHAHFALGRKVDDEVGIFGSYRGVGDASGGAEASVRQAEIGAANRSYERGYGAEIGGGF